MRVDGNPGLWTLFRISLWVLLVYATVWGALSTPAYAQSHDSFRQGLDAARAGQLDRAIELWTLTINRDPKSYAAHVNRGTAYMLTGHVMKGIADWHQARKYSPLFAYAFYRTDFIAENQENQRMLNYAKSLELDPDHIPSVVMMGATYLDLGRTHLAIDLFKKSMDLTRNPMLKNHLQYWVKSLESPSD